tara:strand:- start:1226 stop:1459 length:234 start_codon:yes stop_codon:yes gene_type:complete
MGACLLGWFGVLLILRGYYLIASKEPEAWIYWMVGNFLMGTYSYLIGALPMLLLSAVLIVMNIYGILKWKESESFWK